MDLVDELRDAAAQVSYVRPGDYLAELCLRAATALSAQREAWRILRQALGLPGKHPDGSDILPRVKALRDALLDCVHQYGVISNGKLSSGGFSTLEKAMQVLGLTDPCLAPPELVCDEPCCGEKQTCGWPSPKGYRHTCGKHGKKG